MIDPMRPRNDAKFFLKSIGNLGNPFENELENIIATAMIDATKSERKRIAELEEALGWFVVDPRFVVTVGGSPNAVEKMLDAATALLKNS